MGNGDHPARHLERRWAPRYSLRADLEIEWGSAVLRGSTRDISSSGMFIEAVDPLWLGAGFTARLTLDRPVRLNCFVKRRGAGTLAWACRLPFPSPKARRFSRTCFPRLSNTGS